MVTTPNIRCDRYTFQGQEHDDEVKGAGNSYSYTFRFYDARLGRFLSIDPLFAKYPELSSYSFAENKVIRFVELEGGETDDPLLYHLNIEVQKGFLQQLLADYEVLKADPERLQQKANEAWDVAKRYGTASAANPDNRELAQEAIQATNRAMIADKAAKDALNAKSVAASKIIKFVEETDLEPATEFKAKTSGFGGGGYLVSGSYAKTHVYTQKGTGVIENGATLVSHSGGGGVGTGIKAGGYAGGGKGTIVLKNPGVSLTENLNQANVTYTTEGGVSLGMGYHYQYDVGYKQQMNQEGTLYGTTIYTASFHKFVGGIDVGGSETVNFGTSWELSPGQKIDTSQSLVDNALFKGFDKKLKEKGMLNADTLLNRAKNE